jgi:D-psicose/D-tagatose/L-ribulose 3-epimerase
VNPPGKNAISDDPLVRADTIEHWKRLIATAGEAGVKLIAGPTYSPVGYLPGRRRNEDEWKWGVEFHQQLDAALRDVGAELAIEPLNRFETYFLNTAADTVRFVDEIGSPRIGILFDTFHSNIEEKNIAQGYRLCGSRLKHVHTCENDRGVPGTGHVDWKGVLGTLKNMGYDGWLTIESFNGTIPQLAAATAIWRDLAASMDDIAFEGAAFLKRQWTKENEA